MANLVTFNMQGANASTDIKWQTCVANLMKQEASLLCLQECGAVPASAQVRPGNLAGNANYHLYHWGTDRARKYISYYLWDAGGNRCNLAIVSQSAPTAWLCLQPAGVPAWRPVIGARINGIWYFCLHAISPGGADARGLLAAAAGAVGAIPWFTAGDFNREPAPPLPTGNVCLPNTNTYSTTNPRHKYDYAYSSGTAIPGTVLEITLSDHLPVRYIIP